MRWFPSTVGARLLMALLVAAAPAVSSHAEDVTPADLGTVSGQVVDKGSGAPVGEAGVEIVGATRVETNREGRYSIRVPAGTYEIRFFAPLYRGVRVQQLIVRPNQVSTADAALESLGEGAVETVEVFPTADRATEVAQLAKRKADTVVSETIGRETMKKTVGSGAADVVKRLPGLVVRDGRYLIIRGLGERYVGGLLNENRLPSPDPFRRAIPLDFFPVDFIDDIAVLKTYSPSLPGDFVAGLVGLTLRDFPEKLEYSLGVSTGMNVPQTTGKEFLTSPGSIGDHFTVGEKVNRNPPNGIQGFSAAELPDRQRFALGRRFSNVWSFDTETAPPNYGGTFTIGNRWGPLGVQFGGLYSSEYLQINDAVKRQYRNPSGATGGDEVETINDFDYATGRWRVRMGGVLTSAYEISSDHRLNLRLFVNRSGSDTTQVEEGQVEQQVGNKPREITRQWSLKYEEEQLAFSQLSGAHDFDWIRADWRTALSRTTRNEPDTRFVVYQGPVDALTFSTDSLGGQRLSNVNRENLTDSMLDFTVPFNTRLPFSDLWKGLPASFKFGPAFAYRKRDFEQRRFVFTPDGATQNVEKPPEELLDPDQIGPGFANFNEGTLPSDSFAATQEVIGGYGLFELPIIQDRLRVQGGVRVEYSLIRLSTELRNTLVDGQPVCPGVDLATPCPATFRQKTVDPLPAVNVVLSPLDDMNLRFSWSQSVARPEFRELAPSEFPAQRGERSTFGNPLLVAASITSWDARWEWFFSPIELVSLSFFRKELVNPIEKVSILAGPEIAETWVNADSATLTGFEFEGRKNLEFLARWLEPLSVEINATYIDSSVVVPQQEIFGLPSQQTSGERAMQDAAPFIVNAIIEYSKKDLITANVQYLTVGPTISSAGSVGIPDTILERRNQLNAVVAVPLKRWTGHPLNLRFTAENLMNDPVVFTVGGEVQNRAAIGIKFGLGLSYSF